MRRHLARHAQPTELSDCPLLLVLASRRFEFFERMITSGSTAETSGAATARLYGSSKELVVEGAHVAVVQRCATGQDAEFVCTLNRFLDSESPHE